MYKFKHSLMALIGVVTLIAMTTVLLPHIGYGSSGTGSSAPTNQTQNVKVVNPSTEPVPIQGSATVSGTVQAAQSGTWNVGINGTPVVGLDASNNTVKFDAVNNTVKIDTANPLPVRDVDNPVRQPFHRSVFASLPDGTTFLASDPGLTPPAGKRLVIEQISIGANLPAGQRAACSLVVRNDFAEVLFDHALPMSLQGTFGPIDSFQASLPTRVYLDPSDSVAFDVFRTAATGSAGVRVSFSGYFVDVP